MPTYEYRCENCGELFEVRQKFADEPLSTHEKCGGHVERLLSVPAFQFKGSGWYVTDYAKGGGEKSAANGDSGKAESGEKESGSAKKDSTPAPATSSEKGGSSSSETKSKSSDTKSSSESKSSSS